jgi:hypothetical protein
MKQVKGTMLKTIVKIIRSNKSGVYDTLLSDKAKEYVKQTILDSTWYPFEIYKECAGAYYKVGANNDPATLKKLGLDFGKFLFSTIYKYQAHAADIKDAIEKFNQFIKLAFNFVELVPEYISDNQLKITLKGFDPDWEQFYYITSGFVQEFVELSINKKVTSEIIAKSWEGADATQIMLTWSAS